MHQAVPPAIGGSLRFFQLSVPLTREALFGGGSLFSQLPGPEWLFLLHKDCPSAGSPVTTGGCRLKFAPVAESSHQAVPSYPPLVADRLANWELENAPDPHQWRIHSPCWTECENAPVGTLGSLAPLPQSVSLRGLRQLLAWGLP